MTDEKKKSVSVRGGIALVLLAATSMGGMAWGFNKLDTQNAEFLVQQIEQAPEKFAIKSVPSADGGAGVPDAKEAFLVGHNPDIDMTVTNIVVINDRLPALCVEKQDGSYQIFFPYQFQGDLSPRPSYHKDRTYRKRGEKLNRLDFCEQARSLSTL